MDIALLKPQNIKHESNVSRQQFEFSLNFRDISVLQYLQRLNIHESKVLSLQAVKIALTLFLDIDKKVASLGVQSFLLESQKLVESIKTPTHSQLFKATQNLVTTARLLIDFSFDKGKQKKFVINTIPLTPMDKEQGPVSAEVQFLQTHLEQLRVVRNLKNSNHNDMDKIISEVETRIDTLLGEVFLHEHLNDDSQSPDDMLISLVNKREPLQETLYQINIQIEQLQHQIFSAIPKFLGVRKSGMSVLDFKRQHWDKWVDFGLVSQDTLVGKDGYDKKLGQAIKYSDKVENLPSDLELISEIISYLTTAQVAAAVTSVTRKQDLDNLTQEDKNTAIPEEYKKHFVGRKKYSNKFGSAIEFLKTEFSDLLDDPILTQDFIRKFQFYFFVEIRKECLSKNIPFHTILPPKKESPAHSELADKIESGEISIDSLSGNDAIKTNSTLRTRRLRKK